MTCGVLLPTHCLQRLLVRSAVAATQATTAQTGATDTKVGNLDAIALLQLLDEVPTAVVTAVVVLEGEPGVDHGVDLNALGLVEDGDVTGGQAAESLAGIWDLVLAEGC